MNFSPFFEVFSALSQTELPNILITAQYPHPIIPAGHYAFLEMFCPDVNCDCCKVIIPVVTANPDKTWGVLGDGLASESYYRRWWCKNHSLYWPISGVYFDPATRDPLERAFWGIFKDMIHSDRSYAKRIESHDLMFKAAQAKAVALTGQH